MYCVHTLWLSYFLYHITFFIISCMHDYSSFPSVLLRMCHVTAHNTLHFVPLLYCPIVTHIHIFPCIRILIILRLHSDNAYRYRVSVRVRVRVRFGKLTKIEGRARRRAEG